MVEFSHDHLNGKEAERFIRCFPVDPSGGSVFVPQSAMDVMMKMKKLDIEKLQQAYDGEKIKSYL